MWGQAYKENYKQTFLLAFPVVLSQMGHVMVGVVDTAIVGQIGTVEQAAVALASSFHLLVLVLGIGISFGVTPLVAAADGAKDHSQIASLLKHSIVVNTATGIVLFLALFCFSPILSLLDQKTEVIDLAIPFLNVLMLGMIPLCIFSGFKQFAEGLSFTRVAMIITIGANIINVFLNYALVFGYWGFPKMGMMGSCWASFISRVIMAVAMFAYVYFNKHFKTYWHNFNFKNISKKLAQKILSIGIPSGMQWFFEIGAFSFAIIMVGWISPQAQAAHQIAVSMASITYMMASGLSAAASVRVGNKFGIKDKQGVRIACFSALFMVITFMAFSAICFIVFKDLLPVFFNTDTEVIRLASSLLIIAAFFQLSDGLQAVEIGALRGVQDVKVPTYIALTAYWIIGLPMSYVFGFTFNLGIQGIWYGLALGLLIAAVLLFLRFDYVSKRI
jgi:multidrug resistance protein, MATE family